MEEVIEGAEGQSTEAESDKATIQHQETEIKRLQGLVKAEQKRGVPKAELEAITKRLEAQEVFLAEAFDDLVRRQGDSYEEPRQERKSYKEKLTEQRQAGPSRAEEPEVKAFFAYLEEQGLSMEDDIVKESLDPLEERTPKQAIRFLKEKVKTRETTAMEKTVDEKAEEKAKTLLEQQLKDLGYTASGVLTPGAAGKDVKSMTADEKLTHGFQELTKKR